MIKRYGFKWGVWMGFHSVPSMEHVHLHVLSSDLCSPSMKKKKHYNSFHPKHGFFLHLDDVLSWLDTESSYYRTVCLFLYHRHFFKAKYWPRRRLATTIISQMTELKKSQYEPLLKDDLVCWRCGHVFKNMPTLKAHLQEEWDQEAKAEKTKLERKRKLEENPRDLVEKSDRDPKRREMGVEHTHPESS